MSQPSGSNKSAGTLRDNAGQMAGTAKHQADESVKALGAVEQLAVSMRQVAETAGASSESARQVLPSDRARAVLRCRKPCKTCKAFARRCNACRSRSKRSATGHWKFHKSCRRFEKLPTRPTCSRLTPPLRRPAPVKPEPDLPSSPTNTETG